MKMPYNEIEKVKLFTCYNRVSTMLMLSFLAVLIGLFIIGFHHESRQLDELNPATISPFQQSMEQEVVSISTMVDILHGKESELRDEDIQQLVMRKISPAFFQVEYNLLLSVYRPDNSNTFQKVATLTSKRFPELAEAVSGDIDNIEQFSDSLKKAGYYRATSNISVDDEVHHYYAYYHLNQDNGIVVGKAVLTCDTIKELSVREEHLKSVTRHRLLISLLILLTMLAIAIWLTFRVTKNLAGTFLEYKDNIMRSDLDTAKSLLQQARASEEQIKEQLALSKSRDKAILRTFPDLVFIINSDGFFLDYYAENKSQLILSPEKIIGANISDLGMPELNLKEIQQHIQKALKTKEAVTFEMSMNTPDGIKIYEDRMVALDDSTIIALERDITERKEAEKALRNSEEKFRLITDQSLIGILIIQDERFIYTNQAFQDMSGYSKEEILSWTLEDGFNIIHPDDRPFAREQNRKKMSGETDVVPQYAYRGRHKDGRMIWIEQYSRAIELNGRVALMLTIVDISGRKTAEQALGESEEQLELFFSQSLEGFFFAEFDEPLSWSEDVDKQEVIEYAFNNLKLTKINTAMADLYRTSHNELINCSIADLFSYDIQYGKESLRRLFDERQISIEYREFRFNGDWMWTLSDYICIYTENKMIKGIFGIKKDITERKQTMNELANQKERLAVTLRSIGDGVISTDTDGNVVLMNKVAEEMTGFTTKEAIGKPLISVFNIINEKSRKQVENPVDKVLDDPLTVGLANHTILVSKDGTERNIADSAAPIRDSDSIVIGVVLVFRDISEKHRMELEMQKSERLESVALLAGGIAHDFNNILMAIMGNLNLCKVKLDPHSESYAIATDAENAALRAKKLTHQLLTIAKGGNPVKQTTSLREIIRESSEFVLRGSNAVCNYHFPEDLAYVNVDVGQNGQDFQNLVINANQAMPEGGTIDITLENVMIYDNMCPGLESGEYIKILIEDSGPGMSSETIKRVFDPYFTTKSEGSGLGLSISYSIIKRHMGHVQVESHSGSGTCFNIYLPAVAEKGNNSTGDEENLLVGEGRILLMDDEDFIRRVSGEMLRYLGFEVDTVQNGDELIDYYKRAMQENRPYAVVIMDLTIPGGAGGREAIKHLKKIDPDAKAIVSSGYTTDPIMSEYKQSGFAGVIPKPYKIRELSQLLKNVLGYNDEEKE
ncbi:MAG: PAS domain S-box protein [Candidatus Cloacimonetes bacterium]|nr:PAS domain S-box protein [Candidatus Cloacimonadota bacterium]